MPVPTRTTVPASLALAGVAFVAYPVLRPWGEETGPAGAETFANPLWLVAHVLGMAGFVALAFALRAAAAAPGLPWRWRGRPLRGAETRMWLATALLLPYYGAEAYGLNALGRHAVDTGDTSGLAVAESFRYAPFEVTTFGAGLLLLVLVGGRLAHGLWGSGPTARAGGLLAGLGLATYLPQFFGTPEVRVLHGVVLGLGLLLVARSARRPAAALRERQTGRSSASLDRRLAARALR